MYWRPHDVCHVGLPRLLLLGRCPSSPVPYLTSQMWLDEDTPHHGVGQTWFPVHCPIRHLSVPCPMVAHHHHTACYTPLGWGPVRVVPSWWGLLLIAIAIGGIRWPEHARLAPGENTPVFPSGPGVCYRRQLSTPLAAVLEGLVCVGGG
jgi:hypothetical protein